MASYDAVVNLNVVGTSRLNKVNASINELNKLTLDLNNSLNLVAPGAGKLGDKLRVAFEPIKNFARDATNGVAKFANTLSGAANQAQVFATVLENVNVKAGGFDAQTADVKNLANAWVGATTNLTEYNRRLRQLQETALAKKGLMQLSSGEIVRGTEAGFGQQGPRLPAALGGGMDLPEGVSRLAKPRFRGAQGALSKPGVSDAIIGGAFPALFGAGPGAITGGVLGGLAGGAMGGPLGMALSLALSAVGQAIDGVAVKVRDVGNALQALNVDALRDSFIVVNAELDTTVRRMLEAGNAEAARNELARAAAVQTGAIGSAIADSANATNLLGNAWTDLTGSVGTLLSILAAPFSAALAGILKLISAAAKGVNFILSIVGGGLKAGIEAILTRLPGGKQLLDGIKNATQATNEELEKQKAALTETTDTAHRQLLTAMKLEQIDKQRTHVVTTLGKLINIEADRQAKIVNIRASAEQKIMDLRLKYGNLTDAQSKKELEIAIKQVQAQAAIEIREANRAALRQRLVALNEQLIAQDRLAQQIAANLAAVETARSQAKQQILNADIQGLQLQKQFALSLNEEAAINDKIASKKIEAANESYAQTARELNLKVQLATADLQSVEAAYKRGFATQEQVAQARSNLDTAVATRAELLKGAEATRSQAVAAADVERRQQNVAAFAAEAARQSEAFARAANESTNALNNRVKVSDALAQAALTINNIELQSLQNKLAQAKTEGERLDILDDIREIEIANAGITLQATRAQIRAEVERQRVALAVAEVKFREYLAVVKLAEAQKVVTRAHYEALDAAGSALRIAQDNYRTSLRVADAQWRAADATYNASVNAANMRYEMERTAGAAGAVAGAMDRVAASSGGGGGGGGFLTAANIKNPILRARAEESLAEIDKRTPRTGGIMAILGALSDKQDIVLDYMAIEKRAAREQEMQSAAQELEGMGLGRFVPLQYRSSGRDSLFNRYGSMTSAAGTSSASPQVNITTGPVMQMDGTNYVTQRDLVSATGTAARQGAKMALEMLQNNPASRRSTGVTR